MINQSPYWWRFQLLVHSLSAAVNHSDCLSLHTCLWVFPGCIPRGGIAGWKNGTIFNFERLGQILSQAYFFLMKGQPQGTWATRLLRMDQEWKALFRKRESLGEVESVMRWCRKRKTWQTQGGKLTKGRMRGGPCGPSGYKAPLLF